MLNIKEEIQILLLKQGLSMRKMIRRMKEKNLEISEIGGLSRMLDKKTIKFEKVQQILDFLGYELEIKPKNNK
jgi:hypothetical protein